jgi:hypothetical protein
MADKSGLEKYPPPNRRPPEKFSDVDQVAANNVEDEIRQVVRRDMPFLQRQRSEGNADSSAIESLNALVGRLAIDSMEDIDRVIRDLESIRDMLQKEGQRVIREIAGYTSLSDAARAAMRVIADSIKQWKNVSDKPDASLD